jgi:hypothetical protein
MMILLVRARCQSVGGDNSQQFEPTYNSYLIKAIIEGIIKKYGSRFTGPKMTRLCAKVISVEVEGIELKLKID